MVRTKVLWEAYVTRFEAALDGHRRGRLSSDEAGEALGMSGRQFRRLRVRYGAEGVSGWRIAGLVGCRVGERRRANWIGCSGCIVRNTRTSRSSISTSIWWSGTAIGWATR